MYIATYITNNSKLQLKNLKEPQIINMYMQENYRPITVKQLNFYYTTLTPQIKVNHGDLYQIYPIIMATGRDIFLIYHAAMATGYIPCCHGN